MNLGLVYNIASTWNLSEWQPVKLTFFAPCQGFN